MPTIKFSEGIKFYIDLHREGDVRVVLDRNFQTLLSPRVWRSGRFRLGSREPVPLRRP